MQIVSVFVAVMLIYWKLCKANCVLLGFAKNIEKHFNVLKNSTPTSFSRNKTTSGLIEQIHWHQFLFFIPVSLVESSVNNPPPPTCVTSVHYKNLLHTILVINVIKLMCFSQLVAWYNVNAAWGVRANLISLFREWMFNWRSLCAFCPLTHTVLAVEDIWMIRCPHIFLCTTCRGAGSWQDSHCLILKGHTVSKYTQIHIRVISDKVVAAVWDYFNRAFFVLVFLLFLLSSCNFNVVWEIFCLEKVLVRLFLWRA